MKTQIKLSVFHSIRDEKIAGWSMWTTRENDLYQSIVALNDNLIVAVKRQLNSSTVYTLEKFSDDDSGKWKEEKDYMQGLDPMEVHQNNFLLQANRILDGLEGKECDLASLDEAKLNLKVVFAAKQSWLEKKIITID